MFKKNRKLLIPEMVKIGGMVYTILFPYEFDEAPNNIGLHNYPAGVIKVSDGGRPWAKIHETLLHEIVHAIDYVWLGCLMGHTQIHKLAQGWYQVLCDNNIDWQDYEKIPKKVKVGGYTYKIEYPHRFVDTTEVTWTQVNHQKLVIRMSAGNQEEDWPPWFVKMNLAFVINSAVANIFMEEPIRDWEQDEDAEYDYPPPQVLQVVSNAIYQLLSENPIEECIKNGVYFDKGGK